MRNAVRIDASDNVATVLRDVSEHEHIHWDEGSTVAAREPIPEGHKVALVDIAEGQVVRKYGYPIGLAGRNISAGSHVHTHNLAKEEA
jgi:altronate hydrolase